MTDRRVTVRFLPCNCLLVAQNRSLLAQDHVVQAWDWQSKKGTGNVYEHGTRGNKLNCVASCL